MSFTAKIQRRIEAPVARVWAALTQPEWVKQYFFGSQLDTSWTPGSPIYFRGEWEGKPYEDRGTVLEYEADKRLAYNYFSSWATVEDRPENYQVIAYEVAAQDGGTLLTITQSNVSTEEAKDHSEQNWEMVINEMQKLVEVA